MLPRIEHPIFEIYLHSLNRKVKFRPFLVKEEKLLLIAKESKDLAEIRTTIRQIVTNCILDDVDVDKLPLFDVEMIFLKLRAKSVGEAVKLVFHCNNEVDGVACEADTDYTLDLEKVQYTIPEGHDARVMLTDTVGFRLKYSDLSNRVTIKEGDNAFDVMVEAIVDNIEEVFDGESVYKAADVPREELKEFLDNLTVEGMARVERFFSTAPKVVLEDTVKCKKCGFEHKLHAENLLDFFI